MFSCEKVFSGDRSFWFCLRLRVGFLRFGAYRGGRRISVRGVLFTGGRSVGVFRLCAVSFGVGEIRAFVGDSIWRVVSVVRVF